MGQRLKDNFNRRFGNRISIIYSNKPAGTSEQHIQNENIWKAFSNVLSGIIGREPTQAELFGIVDISIKRGKSKVVKRREKKNELAKNIS